ncbi:hypothetical protein L1885_21370, partial [Streptomyces fuscigenes]|nr:hypothetical protein [Streptomyces fuscigenes]
MTYLTGTAQMAKTIGMTGATGMTGTADTSVTSVASGTSSTTVTSGTVDGSRGGPAADGRTGSGAPVAAREAVEALKRWRRAGMSTAPADRPAAERGIRLAYRLAGLPEPGTVVWADSPRAGVEAVRRLADPGRSVRDEVRTRPW